MTLDDRIEEFLTGKLGDAAQERARADAAEAEVARLRLERDGWMKASDEANAENERLRAREAQLETELAMTSNALRVTQDSVLRNIDRADAAEAEVARLRAALQDAHSVLANLDDNLRLSRDTWTAFHSDIARQRISLVLTAANTRQDAVQELQQAP